jgi:protein-S-isoprenylcysteine O-methyltransferase Ste14
MMSDYVLLAFLWAAYCCVHSALISMSLTTWLRKVLAGGYRFYRLLFNLFSIITLIPLVMYSHSARFQSEPLFVWDGYWRIARYLLISVAVALVVAGARHYSMLQFLGIQQIRTVSTHSALTGSGAFDSTGVLALTRHPWYVAVFSLLWAGDLNAAAITVNVILSAYLVVGTLLEEHKLVIEFGDEYRKYQNRVSMFFPLKWLTGRQPR